MSVFLHLANTEKCDIESNKSDEHSEVRMDVMWVLRSSLEVPFETTVAGPLRTVTAIPQAPDGALPFLGMSCGRP